MSSQLVKWGDSLAVQIPKELAERAQLHEGDPLDLSLNEEGAVVIRPIVRKQHLDQLIDQITPQNQHHETDWGEPMGKEIW